MAHGELKIHGDEIVEALTTCDHKTNYETVLNDDGEKLAQLITARVLEILGQKLSRPDPE